MSKTTCHQNGNNIYHMPGDNIMYSILNLIMWWYFFILMTAIGGWSKNMASDDGNCNSVLCMTLSRTIVRHKLVLRLAQHGTACSAGWFFCFYVSKFGFFFSPRGLYSWSKTSDWITEAALTAIPVLQLPPSPCCGLCYSSSRTATGLQRDCTEHDCQNHEVCGSRYKPKKHHK